MAPSSSTPRIQVLIWRETLKSSPRTMPTKLGRAVWSRDGLQWRVLKRKSRYSLGVS